MTSTRDFLLATLADPDALTSVVDRSYWHPNNFAKLVLLVDGDRVTRLHVWPAGTGRTGDCNPHGHRWSFTSTVLCGALEDVHYDDVTELDVDTAGSYVRYAFADRNTRDAMACVGPARLRRASARVRPAGTRYELSTDVVHTVRPLGSTLVASRVTQGPPELVTARVYGLPGVDVAAPGRALAIDEARELLTDVVTELSEVSRE